MTKYHNVRYYVILIRMIASQQKKKIRKQQVWEKSVEKLELCTVGRT